MLPKPRKKDVYKLCNEELAANICSTDPRSQSPTVPSPYMRLEGVVNGVGHSSTDSLYLVPDENGSSFVGSMMTNDDTDDIALPPSSSSPPDFASSSPRPNSEESTASETSVSSTPSAFFSLKDGQYLVSGDKRESLDDFARRLNDPQRHAAIKHIDLNSIVGSSQQRWSSTLEMACDPFLASSCSTEHRIFSRIGSPKASNLSNSHSSSGITTDRYDLRNVRLTESDPRSRQVFASMNLQGGQTPDSGQETNISPITFCPNYGLQESWVPKIWSELHSSRLQVIHRQDRMRRKAIPHY